MNEHLGGTRDAQTRLQTASRGATVPRPVSRETPSGIA